jgi:3',5'-cyclic AMP phosphodiesterase CpdA
MNIYAEKLNMDFLLALGDNFYEKGVVSEDDPQWTKSYEDVYNFTSLQKPWYALLGNHDHAGNASAQIDYFLDHLDNRWIMPDYWYSKTFAVDSNTTMQVVFIDTVLLSKNTTLQVLKDNIKDGILPPEYYQKVEQSISLLKGKADQQLAWIEDTLKQSTAQWLFVGGHYPVYSGGEHGNTPELDKDLLPLLEKYKVDAYLCGHDHTMQHLQSNSVEYFVSGNGCKRGSITKLPQTKFAVVDPGFMIHRINSTAMLVDLVDGKGSIIYSYAQKQRRH